MNAIKKKILSGEVAIGTWMQIMSGDISEMVGMADYDFCAVDMEHTDASNSDLSNIYRGLKGTECQCAARVDANELMSIRKALDLGATVILVPLINNAEQARNAVNAVKYPPVGVRGFAFTRANGWGVNFDSYVKKINDEVLLIAMVETIEAVENIDEILFTDGIDGILVGPYDLSGSLKVPGEINNGLVKDALKRVALASKKHNKIAGQHIVNPTKEKVDEAIEQGYSFLALGMDSVFITEALKKCRQMYEKPKQIKDKYRLING